MPSVAVETELQGSPTLLSIPLRPGQRCRRPVRKGAQAAATWTCPPGSCFSAKALQDKYIHTLELLQLLAHAAS